MILSRRYKVFAKSKPVANLVPKSSSPAEMDAKVAAWMEEKITALVRQGQNQADAK